MFTVTEDRIMGCGEENAGDYSTPDVQIKILCDADTQELRERFGADIPPCGASLVLHAEISKKTRTLSYLSAEIVPDSGEDGTDITAVFSPVELECIRKEAARTMGAEFCAGRE